MEKRLFYILILMCLHMVFIPLHGQHVSLKSNLLYLGTSTPNMGFEFRLGRKMSLDLWCAYDAWEFKNDMSLKHYLVQPELRYWPCQTYEGHFFGLHGHYGHFNIGNIPFIPGMEEKNYRGELYGGGLTWGYHWVIGCHWGGKRLSVLATPIYNMKNTSATTVRKCSEHSATLPACTLAEGGEGVPPLRITFREVEVGDDTVLLHLQFVLEDIRVPSSRSLVLEPRLEADGHSLTLPDIVVSGRRRARYDARALAVIGPYPRQRLLPPHCVPEKRKPPRN